MSADREALKAALLLQRVGQHLRAIALLRAVLTRNPHHVEALRCIAPSWLAIGETQQARSALERAHATAPDDLSLCLELAALYSHCQDHLAAQRVLLAALEVDPNAPAIHEALAQTLQSLGDRGAALEHRQRSRAMVARRLPVITHDSDETVQRCVVLVNHPHQHALLTRLLRHHDLQLFVLALDSLTSNTPLPEYDALLNAVSFDAHHRALFQHLEDQVAQRPGVVINRPAAVLSTDPAILAWRLAPIEHVRLAAVVRLERESLLASTCAQTLAEHQLSFPLLVQPGGGALPHEHLASLDDLHAFVASTATTQFLCAPFFDLRSVDGRVRYYRVVVIGGVSYPLACAGGFHWRVAWTSADEPSPALQAHENEFLADLSAALGDNVRERLSTIVACLEIDLCMIDFSLAASGEVTVLRLDAGIDWQEPPEGETFARRREASERARRALQLFVLRRIKGAAQEKQATKPTVRS